MRIGTGGPGTGYFNGSVLSAGEHYLVIERTPHVVAVRQPVGADTVLAVDAPSDWHEGEPLHVRAFDRVGQALGEAGFWTEGRVVKFIYRQKHDSQRVGHYEVVNSFQAYLPLTIRGR